MTPDEMKRLHDEHLAAEAAYDVPRIMATYHEDCWYDRVPFGFRLHGKDAIAAQYTAFFTAFPDAGGTEHCEAFGDDFLLDRGTASVTMTGPFMGLAPTGRHAEIEFARMVTFRDGLIEGEMTYFDLAGMCEQLGVPLDTVRATVRELADAFAAPKAV